MSDLRRIKKDLDKLDLVDFIKQQLEAVRDGRFVTPAPSGPPRIRVFRQDQDDVFFLQLLDQPAVTWTALLDLLLPRADTISFRADACTRFNLGPEAVVWQWTPLDALKRSLTSGGSTPEHTGSVYTFELTPDVLAFLRSVPSLRDWHAIGQMPEDPALFAQAQPLLWTIRHENMVWAKLTFTNLQALQAGGILVKFAASD
jgi:hypothetical protein